MSRRQQLARTPDNFPRMKHRAAGRLQRKRGHGKIKIVEAVNVFAAISKFINDGIEGAARIFEGIAKAFTAPPTKADFVLIPGIPDGLLRDPEGRALVAKIHARKQARNGV